MAKAKHWTFCTLCGKRKLRQNLRLTVLVEKDGEEGKPHRLCNKCNKALDADLKDEADAVKSMVKEKEVEDTGSPAGVKGGFSL